MVPLLLKHSFLAFFLQILQKAVALSVALFPEKHPYYLIFTKLPLTKPYVFVTDRYRHGHRDNSGSVDSPHTET